jgi:hypothetical protein
VLSYVVKAYTTAPRAALILCVAALCGASGILGALTPHALQTLLAKRPPLALSPPVVQLNPRHPSFDPIGTTFHDVSERTEIPCAETMGDDAAAILVLGQSLSANENAPGSEFTPPHDVFNFNFFDGKCYVAKDPLLGATGANSSYLGRLGALLVASGTYRRVLLIPAAQAGSFISFWVGDGILTARLPYVLEMLQRSHIVLTDVLWQQGEAESGLIEPDVEAYRRNFLEIVSTIRHSQFAPIYISQSTICRDVPNSTIRGVQRSLVDPTLGINSGPDTDTIPLSERFDGCHLNAAGLNHMAELWANVLVPPMQARRD